MNPNEWFQPSPHPTQPDSIAQGQPVVSPTSYIPPTQPTATPPAGAYPGQPAQGYPAQPQLNAFVSVEPSVSGLELAAEGVEQGASHVLWLGVFLVIVLLATSVVVVTNPGDIAQKLPRLIITATDVLLAGGVILCGRRIQTAAPDHTRALKAMTMSIVLCGGIFGLSAVEFFLTKRSVPPLQGVLGFAASIFLVVKHVQLKKLA